MQNKILITFDSERRSALVDSTGMMPGLDGTEYLSLLAETYISEAGRLIRAHVCNDPDCRFKELHESVIAGIRSALNMHELKYKNLQ